MYNVLCCVYGSGLIRQDKMNTEIIKSLIATIPTLIIALVTVVVNGKLIVYRIDQLEKKVEKHNSIVERLAVLEQKTNAAFSRIDELREDIKQLS